MHLACRQGGDRKRDVSGDCVGILPPAQNTTDAHAWFERFTTGECTWTIRNQTCACGAPGSPRSLMIRIRARSWSSQTTGFLTLIQPPVKDSRTAGGLATVTHVTARLAPILPNECQMGPTTRTQMTLHPPENSSWQPRRWPCVDWSLWNTYAQRQMRKARFKTFSSRDSSFS